MIAATVIAGSGLCSKHAVAQCTYNLLTSGTSTTVSTTPTFRRFTQGTYYWSAVGIRSAPGDNWDLGVYLGTAASPTCVSLPAKQSLMASGVDFVIGDFNPAPSLPTTCYVKSERASGAGPAVLEWDDGSDILQVNQAFVHRATDASDVLEVWDVFLDADVTYVFWFGMSGADMKFYIFENAAQTQYWAGPGDAKKVVNSEGWVSYTPQASGFHSVVAVNQNGASGLYSIAVATCTAPIPLTPDLPVTSSLVENYYSFHQTAPYWTGVGVRGTQNWQLGAYRSQGIGLYPTCLIDSLTGSIDPEPAVDFVLGDFNNEVQGTYFISSYIQERLFPGTGTIEWDSGSDVITVGDPFINVPVAAGSVLDVYDVFLEAGQEYNMHFFGSSGQMELLLMRDTGLAWFGRAQAEFTTVGNHTYTAPVEGFYCLVVVNKSGASGSYELGVNTQLVAVESDRPTRSGLSSVMPNPSRGKLRISYTLAQHASASFEVLDITGRVVSRIPTEGREPGRWEVLWSGAREDGKRVAPGVYFVRMRLDGRSVAQRKVIVLR